MTSVGESALETYSLSDMDIIIKDYPELALKIMRTLVDRLIDTDDEPGGVYI